MTDNPWFKKAHPNLSKLPLPVREGMSQPVPLRPTESYGAVYIFQSVGAIHPNGRINISLYRPDQMSALGTEKAIQIDLADFTGRIPAATVMIGQANAKALAAAFLRAYQGLGGNTEELLAETNKEISIQASAIYVEDAKSND